MRKSIRQLPNFVVALLVLLSVERVGAETPTKLTGRTMGTSYAVTVPRLPVRVSQSDLEEKVQRRLDVINKQMSTWDLESEISHFNQSDSLDWFPISAEFLEVVIEAKRIYKVTRGAFDPTVSPVIDLWGFGDKRPKAIPSDQQIETALNSIGMKHIEVQVNPPAIRKGKVDLQLNLSAIAKGYAVDDLAKAIQGLGVSSFLVDIGGETRAGTEKPDGSYWKLGVESPLGGLQQVVPLINESIATSGDYRNFFEFKGKKYSHAINPVTGSPVIDPPAAVSVRHASCMSADAFATALMVMDQDEAIRVAEAENLSVLFQRVNDAGDVDLIGTGSFSRDDAESNKSSGTNNSSSSQPSRMWVPFVAAAALFLLAVGAMSLGTMIQNRQIKGSCGGLASLPGHDGKSACDLCSIPRDQCTNAEVKERIRALAEDSTQQLSGKEE